MVIGDTVPHIDHLAHHYEIVEHLRQLQEELPDFEVGMPTRFREWQFRRRIDLGTQFFVAGPVLDPEVIGEQMGRLNLKDGDPPVYLMIIPPFNVDWVEQMESIGAVPVTAGLKRRLEDVAPDVRRKLGWEITAEMEAQAREAGAGGVILMGLKFESVIDEAAEAWPEIRIARVMTVLRSMTGVFRQESQSAYVETPLFCRYNALWGRCQLLARLATVGPPGSRSA